MEHLFILAKKFHCCVDTLLPNPEMYLRISESNQEFSSEYLNYSEFESALIEELKYQKKGGNSINE